MKIHSEQEMLALGKQIADYLSGRVTDLAGLPRSSRREEPWEGKVRQDPPGSIVIELIGDVGTGKTTLTRGLAQGLDINKPITSPSFTISKSYALPSGGSLIHYDFYRLPDPGLMQSDLSEAISDPRNIVVIEWADSVSSLLPDNRITINISYTDTDGRDIIIS